MKFYFVLRFAVVSSILLLSNFCFAQKKASVSGTVQDSLQKPLVFATVSLVRPNNPGEIVKTTYTNDKGKFKLTGVDTGKYTIAFSHTGYGTREQALVVGTDDVQLEDIRLHTGAVDLKGVTVTVKKPLIEQSDDKVIFNVENDPTTKTETAIDILRKTPFVTVDGDDNVQVNGQSNFKVLLNGRETAMFAQNVKEALKSFPGALITKIEVITTPSAKYDAEGVGGIINIITKKKMKGYNGSLSAYYSNTGWYNGNANFSMKTGKVGISFFQYLGGVNGMASTRFAETTPYASSIFTRRVLQGRRTMTNLWGSGNGEISWEMDSLNTLSTYFNFNSGTNKNKLDQTITTEFPSAPSSMSLYIQDSRFKWPNSSIGTDYIKKFSDNKEKEFSIRFNSQIGRNESLMNSAQDNPGTDRFVINNSVAKNNEYTLQSDLIQPLKKNRKIEVGAKAILRKASSDFESMIKYDANENYKLNQDNTDHFRYSQDVYSGYGMYGFKVQKTSFRLGGRVEHTEVNGNFISAETKVKQSYTSFLPNLQSSTRFNNSYTLVITYSQRLQRPYIWNLNPFVNNNDSLNIFYGNPDLDAQTIHSLAFQNRFMKGSTFFGLTLTGTYSNNMINQYSSFNPSTGVTSTTSANNGREVSVSLAGNINTKFNKDWSLSVNGNVRYNHVVNKFNTSQRNGGIGGNANLNSTYVISKKFSISSYAGFWGSPVTIQGTQSLNIWYGTGLVYKFFNEKLSANLSAANFLQKEREYRYTIKDPLFQTVNINTQPFRAIALNLTWNFGKLTENVSKKKGVNNDDLLGNGQTGN